MPVSWQSSSACRPVRPKVACRRTGSPCPALNSALAVYAVGNSHLGADQLDDALRLYDRTVLLSPLDPDLPAILTNKAAALIGLGRYETSLAIIRSARAQQDVPLHGWIIEVAALCRLGRIEEARSVVRQI